MKHRTPAYWSTRLLLAVGIVATVAVVLLAREVASPAPSFGFAYPALLGVPGTVLEAALAVLLAAIGLIWMIRIFRGPRDDPGTWRYRDR